MPRFNEHIEQARHNILFLEFINKSGNDFCDWQVTTCFYIGVHLINAHLSMFNMQYRKHVDVKDNKLYETNAALTHEIHLGKALRHIDTLIRFLSSKYQFQVSPINIQCAEIKKGELSFSSV